MERRRLPSAPLNPPKSERRGGWDLINLQAKSLALFLYRMRIQDQRDGTLSAEWMRKWTLTEQSKNPPFRERIPAALGIRIYVCGPTRSKGITKSIQETDIRHNAQNAKGGVREPRDEHHKIMASCKMESSVKEPL